MSQAPRTLAEANVYVRRYSGRRSPARTIRNFVLLVILVASVWFFWVTRDNWPMARLVPKDPAFQLCATDLLLNRKEIAASRVWELAPPDSAAPEIRTALAGNFGLPEWVINNLIQGLGLVSGESLGQPDNAIFVTRISRVGCALEKLRGFSGQVEDDPAGGLGLRYVKAAEAYYALRGRVIVASRSREALIRALTLRDDQCLSPEDFAAVQEAAAGRNLLATVRPRADKPLGGALEQVDLTIALKQDAVQLDCKATPHPEFAPALDAIFGAGKLPVLPAPVSGLVEVAGDFGRPFTEVWSALLLGFPENGALQSARKSVDGMAESMGDKKDLVTKSLNALGTGFSLSWTGMDTLEVVPAPQLVARIDAPQAAGYQVLVRAALPRTITTNEDEVKPWFDDTAKLAIFPMIGGPSMHPAVAFKDQKIVIASSSTLAREFLAGQVPLATDEAQGNLLVRVRVAPAVAAVFAAGQEFADSGFIKGHTAESFHEFAAQWTARAAQVDQLTGLFAYGNGLAQLRLTLTMAQQQAAPAAPAPAPGS